MEWPHFLYSVLPYFSDSEYESEHEYDKYLMTKFKEKVELRKTKIFYTTKRKWVNSKGVYFASTYFTVENNQNITCSLIQNNILFYSLLWTKE